MKRLALKPRVAAIVIACIGFVFTYVNRQTVLNERNYYPMLMLFGPVCILYGIAGLIDPRVMNQTTIPTPQVQNIFRAIVIAIVLAGLAVGLAMAHFWYKIW